MTQDLELSITICSWNTLADTRACLASLEELKAEARFETILIDNGSSDGSPEMVESEFPSVRLIRSPINLGFTGGHNTCLELRLAPDALLLNSDTIVHPGALRRLIDYRNGEPKVGIIGPQLLNPDGSLQLSCRRFPNPVAALFRNTFVGRLFPNNRFTRDYLMQDWSHLETRFVDWVSGAAFYVTDEVINQVGTFDDEYFMYCEDVDWCFRARKAGFEVAYLPSAQITHAIGTSSSKMANKMIIRFHRSMYRFYSKNVVSHQFWLVRPFSRGLALVGLGARASLFLTKNYFDAAIRKLRRAGSGSVEETQ